jgi:hypothetical protein
MMTSTSIRAGRGADQTHAVDPRSAESSALRAAGRQLLATAGNQVLKAAVDRAVGRVDQAADRLDAVAAGEGRAQRPTPSRDPAERPEQSGVQRAGRSVQVRIGAALSLVVHQATRILQLIQRLAQQLVAALARLVRRDTADTRKVRDADTAASGARSPQAAERSRTRSATEPTSRRRRAASERSVGTGRDD